MRLFVQSHPYLVFSCKHRSFIPYLPEIYPDLRFSACSISQYKPAPSSLPAGWFSLFPCASPVIEWVSIIFSSPSLVRFLMFKIQLHMSSEDALFEAVLQITSQVLIQLRQVDLDVSPEYINFPIDVKQKTKNGCNPLSPVFFHVPVQFFIRYSHGVCC